MASERAPIPSWYFAVVVVHRAPDEFLLVQERKHGQLWYLPAGRAEAGETLADAARRETREEAGIDVVLEGVLRVEHSPHPDGTARVRGVFLARPALPAAPLKSAPDEHSLEARWVSLRDLDALPLRGEEVREVLHAVAAGWPVAPLRQLAGETAPWAG